MRESISSAKNKYIEEQMCEKVNGLQTRPKTYCKLLNRLLNNKMVRVIPPLLVNEK